MGLILGWSVWIDTPEGVDQLESRATAWADVPDDGIIYKMLYKNDGDGLEENQNPNLVSRRESMVGVDHYFEAPHADGTIYGSSNDPAAEIVERYPGAIIKRGKWVPLETFDKVRRLALEYVW